jgi:molybdopterin-binding protein
MYSPGYNVIPAVRQRGTRMRISARNRLKDRVVEVVKGQTTAHVRIDVAGTVVAASITNEAADELSLKQGEEA